MLETTVKCTLRHRHHKNFQLSPIELPSKLLAQVLQHPLRPLDVALQRTRGS